MSPIHLNHEWRPGTGAPLVLLHEMGGSLHSWDLVMRALPRDVAVLRPDLRGFGLSEKPVGPMDLEDMAADVLDLMDWHGIGQGQETAHLAGCAVGAAVAIGVADAAPGRVSGLTLFAPATGVPPERRDGIAALAARFRAEGVRGFLEEDTFPGGWPEEKIPRGEGFALFRDIQLGCCPETLARCNEMLGRIDLLPALAGLDCPVHVVAGAHDVMRPAARLRPIAEGLKQGRFTLLPGAGHFMPLQAPREVAALLEKALQGLASTAAGS